MNILATDVMAIDEALVSPLLVVSGAMKLVNLPAFIVAVRRYDIVRGSAGEWVGRGIPIVEVATGLLLFARWHELIWLFVALVFMALASGAVVIKLIQGQRVPCACFGGTDETLIGWQVLARNVAILALLVVDITARINGVEGQLMMSEWVLLFAAGGAFWILGAQASLALPMVRPHTDT